MSLFSLTREQLWPLKALLFCLFGGLGCLIPALPQLAENLGLTLSQARTVAMATPWVSTIGPAVIGPMADKHPKYLGPMLGVICAAGAISHLLLLAVPPVQTDPAADAPTLFICNSYGAHVIEPRCPANEDTCRRTNDQLHHLHLSNCHIECLEENEFSNEPSVQTSPLPYNIPENSTPSDSLHQDNEHVIELSTNVPEQTAKEEEEVEDEDGSGAGADHYDQEYDQADDMVENRKRRSVDPHLCLSVERDEKNSTRCHVIQMDGKNLTDFPLDLTSGKPYATQQCKYKIANRIWCRNDAPRHCHLNCALVEEAKTCHRKGGDPALTFTLYLVLRMIADLFPGAAVALAHAAVIHACRDDAVTTPGRRPPRLGHQLAAGCLGYAIATAAITAISGSQTTIAICCSAVLLLISALISVFYVHPAPLWWLQARSGIPARTAGAEATALLLILVFLGLFWSGVHSYLPWQVVSLGVGPRWLGLGCFLAALPAVPILWHSERLTHICGHSNLLIAAFACFIIQYTLLSIGVSGWWAIGCQLLEVTTIGLAWAVAVISMRQLAPRRWTAAAQAAVVAAVFCVGRGLGAIMGACYWPSDESYPGSLIVTYRVGAILAAIVSSVYFILYHCCLRPRWCMSCGKDKPSTSYPSSSPVNGSGAPNNLDGYSPLRMYHNGSGGIKGIN